MDCRRNFSFIDFDTMNIAALLPKSIGVKKALVILCYHIEQHPNVKHPVNRFQLRVNTIEKVITALIYHPGTKKPTYSNDVLDNGRYYPIKYELPGYGHIYPVPEGKVMIRMIEELVKREVKTEDKTDYLEIDYDDSASEIPCTIYMTKANGEKHKLIHIIK